MKKIFYPLILASILVILISPYGVNGQTVGWQQHRIYSAPTVNDVEPAAGQKWSVSDGLAIFSFFISTQGDILFQNGYPYPPSAYAQSLTTFINHTYSPNVLLTQNPFTLTQGGFYTPPCPPEQNNPPQHQCIGTQFEFEAVWVCGATRICIIQLYDPLLSDSNGFHYFGPDRIFNQTPIQSIQTDGTPSLLTATNLPNGDVLIGDSEYVNGTFQATIYWWAFSLVVPCTGINANGDVTPLGCGGKVPFTKIGSFSSTTDNFFSVQAAYLNPFVYYVVGRNCGCNGHSVNPLKLYQATQGNNWVPNGTEAVTGYVIYANQFSAAADPTHLYVASESNGTFYVETGGSPGSGKTLLAINETTTLGALQGGEFSGPHNHIFLSTLAYGTGAHFYYDYEMQVGSVTQLMLGFVYSYDGGHLWSMSNQYYVQDVYALPNPPSLSGPPQPPFSYDNQIDYLTLTGVSPTDFVVDSFQVNLPSIVSFSVTTSTNFLYAINTENTVTVSTMTGLLVQDLGTPAVMLITVAVPAAVFGMFGRRLGGGRAGVVLVMVGAGIGLVAGILYGIYPSWSLIIVALGIVAAILPGGGGSQPEPEAT
jgi:hypothetical protein